MKNKIFTWSNYTHWCIKVKMPSDGWDEYRAKLYIGIWHLFIDIPLWKATPWTEFGKDAPSYGISYHDSIFWIHYGADKWYTIDMPWQWEIVRHDLLFPDGTVYHRNKYPTYTLHQKKSTVSWFDIFEKNQTGEEETQLARYVDLTHYTKDGRKQVARIRLTGEEREWRWKWFKWLPWPNQKHRVVDCSSDEELGERAGSWKGGMIGWSVPWNKNESMETAFWRWYKKWDGN
jgi:hypothetical protein